VEVGFEPGMRDGSLRVRDEQMGYHESQTRYRYSTSKRLWPWKPG